MDEPQRVRHALTILADRGVGRVQPPSVAALRRRQERRRRGMQTVSVVAAVAVIAGAAAVVVNSRTTSGPAVPPAVSATDSVRVTDGTTTTRALTSKQTRPPARNQSPQTTVPSPPPAQMRLAVAETERLLTLFTVPASAVRLTVPPKAMPSQAMGTPASGSLIDTVRYWKVPMPFTKATGWVTAHPPRGLTSNGSSKLTSHGRVTSTGYEFADDRTSSAWTDASLQITIGPAGTAASYWRIDAVASWRTTTPVSAASGGIRLAVPAAGRCPASDRRARDVPAGSPHALLPTGPPTSGLICAYSGYNGDPFALKQQLRIGPEDAARLARLANAIDLSHTLAVTMGCPLDRGTATVLAFAYPEGTSAELWLADSGCRFVSNGTIKAQAVGGDNTGLTEFSTAVDQILHPH